MVSVRVISLSTWAYPVLTRKSKLTCVKLWLTVFRALRSFRNKGALGLDDEGLYKTLGLAKELGVIVTAHCENADLIAQLQAKLLSEGKTGPSGITIAGLPWLRRRASTIWRPLPPFTAPIFIRPHQLPRICRSGFASEGKGRQNMDRNAYPVSDSRQNGCGKTKFSGSQVRHVSTASGSF